MYFPRIDAVRLSVRQVRRRFPRKSGNPATGFQSSTTGALPLRKYVDRMILFREAVALALSVSDRVRRRIPSSSMPVWRVLFAFPVTGSPKMSTWPLLTSSLLNSIQYAVADPSAPVVATRSPNSPSKSCSGRTSGRLKSYLTTPPVVSALNCGVAPYEEDSPSYRFVSCGSWDV